VQAVQKVPLPVTWEKASSSAGDASMFEAPDPTAADAAIAISARIEKADSNS